MKITLSLLLLWIALTQATAVTAQTRQERRLQRAMEQRGTDSAWIYNAPWDRTRYFIGSKQVSPLEFENTLRTSDREIDQLVGNAWGKMNTGRILGAAGVGIQLTGLVLLNNNSYYYENRDQTAAIALVLGGLGLELTGLIMQTTGATRFRRGVLLFNKKAKSNRLEPLTIRTGTTRHGWGLTVNF
jgi:hypothetical protein